MRALNAWRRACLLIVLVGLPVCQWAQAADWDEVAAAGAYETYEALRKTLAEGTADPDSIAAFDAVLVAESDRRRIREQLDRLGEEKPGNVAARLYRTLMTAEANPDVLYEYLDARLAVRMALAEDNSTRLGAYYAWRPVYLLETALTAFEKTDQKRFLDLSVAAMLTMAEGTDRELGRTDELRGRELKAWGSAEHDEELYTSVVTHAGRIATPMARFAWIVEQRPELHEPYGQAAETLLETAAAALREYDDEFYVEGAERQRGYYWRTVADEIEALNHLTSVGEALLYLARTTDEPLWDRRLEQLANFVRDALYRQDNGTVAWDYMTLDYLSWLRPRDIYFKLFGHSEPVWKGHVTIRFMVYAEQEGVAFSRDELVAVAESVRINVMRDGNGINAQIAEDYVSLKDSHGDYGDLVPYLLLAPYDARLGEAIVDLVAECESLGGWLDHPKGAVAYAMRLELEN